MHIERGRKGENERIVSFSFSLLKESRRHISILYRLYHVIITYKQSTTRWTQLPDGLYENASVALGVEVRDCGHFISLSSESLSLSCRFDIHFTHSSLKSHSRPVYVYVHSFVRAYSASGLWGLTLRSPVHGGVYGTHDGVPVKASLIKPEVRCNTALGCPEPTLQKEAVICFWLSGKLQNCVLVTRLVDEDLTLRALSPGTYSLRAQLFGMTVKNNTFPLSKAETVSFTTTAEGFVVPDATFLHKQREINASAELLAESRADKESDAVLTIDEQDLPVACTIFPPCRGDDECDTNARPVLLDVFRPSVEDDEAFTKRALRLLVTRGGYKSRSLNPNIERDLRRWREHQFDRRLFRRSELRYLLSSSSSAFSFGLIVGGLQPQIRCSTFGYNVTTEESTSTRWLFLPGSSPVDFRNQTDVMSVFAPNSIQSIVTLPSLWGGLSRRQLARLVRTVRVLLREGGELLILESAVPTQAVSESLLLAFDAAGLKPISCPSTSTASLLKNTVPTSFWDSSGVVTSQCVLRARRAIRRTSHKTLNRVVAENHDGSSRNEPDYATPIKRGQTSCPGSVCSDLDIKRVLLPDTSMDTTFVVNDALSEQVYDDVYVPSAVPSKTSSSTSCRCSSRHESVLDSIPGVDRVVVLNLDRRQDRWDRFVDRLSDVLSVTNMPLEEEMGEERLCSWSECVRRKWRRVAVDGTSLDMSSGVVQAIFNETAMDRQKHVHHNDGSTTWCPLYGHRWQRGVLGCALSHVGVWNAIARTAETSGERDVWLVLEDDVEFASNFVNRWTRLLSDLESLEWDLMYLGWTDDRPIYDDVRLMGPNGATGVKTLSHQPRSVGGGTFAYAIRPSAARAFLRQISERGISSPVDWFMMSTFGAQHIRAVKCDPHLAFSPHVLFDPSADSDVNTGRGGGGV